MITKNNGFVFVETITVMLVLMVSLTGMYTMFNGVLNNIETRKEYDTVNDIFKVRIVKNLIDTDITENYIVLTPTNCTTYMNNDCTEIFNEFNIEQALIVNGLDMSQVYDLSIPNSMKEYVKTIEKEDASIVVQFTRNSSSYFASLLMEES